MGSHWLPAIGCLCLLVSIALPAAVPTPDTMVVARSEEGDAVSTTQTVTEATTQESMPPIKMTEMEVTSNIALRYAHTAVTTRVRNPAKHAQEATFRLLLPETAFISSFTMILDGKPYRAYVKEKEEAKQIYNQAVMQGLGAAHVATTARDSNHFTVSVNVEPNQEAVFNLTYEEMLTRRNGVYNHAVNLHPGALVPKLTVTVNIHEAQKITALRVPELRTGNEIDASPEDPQNAMATIVRGQNERQATITFKPDLEEQQRLISIYLEKTKETNPRPYRYYGYEESEDDAKDKEGTLGQFVVQYDVERPKDGEILVNDGYFVHFYAPSDLPPLSKHVVFVLDTSGSMMDRKIIQLREAMQTILSELNPGDYFNIVEFSSSVQVHDLKEADQEPTTSYSAYGPYSFAEQNEPAKLVPPAPATPANLAKAKVIVSRLHAAGGTNIYSALDVAVTLIKKGVGWTEPPATNATTPSPPAPTTPASSTTAAEGSTTTPAPPTSSTAAEVDLAASSVKPASDDTKKDVPELEPTIIFLTDGDPTVGQTDPGRIINHLTEKNAGLNKATIYSLAFGEDADRKFLRKLSLRNDGFMRHIYEAADAALQLRDFYRQVASPLLADVKFVYPKKQVKADSLTKHRFRRYYSGAESVVAGQIEPDVKELTPTVGAFCGTTDLGGKKYIEIVPKAPVPVAKDNYLPLERLWAYLTVRQLLDERDARDAPADSEQDTPDKKALDIALKYSFVTPLTSLVVVKPNDTAAVDAESVDKQNPAVGYGAAVMGNMASRVAVSKISTMPLSGSYTGLAGAPGLAGPPGRPLASFAFAAPMPMSAHVDLPQTSQVSYFSTPAASFRPADAFFPAASFDAVEEEEPLYDNIGVAGIPSANVTSPLDPLDTYNLRELPWLQSLLAGDQLVLPANATDPSDGLKLSVRGQVIPGSSSPGASCPAAAGAAGAAGGAGAGVCVYITRCAAAQALTADTYPAFHCNVEGYAGVCCPTDQVDVAKKN